MLEQIYEALAWLVPLVVAVTLHEVAHGWMALAFGDQTARQQGRLSLNPLRHVDRFGTIILPLLLFIARSPFIFGYARPVPVTFENLHPPRMGMFMVSVAGVCVNLILAMLSASALHLEAWLTPEDAPFLYLCLYRSIVINCVLAIFNLIPILPFDGGRAVYAILPAMAQRLYAKTEHFGMPLVFLILLVPSLIDHYAGTSFNLADRLLGVPVLALVEMVIRLCGHMSV